MSQGVNVLGPWSSLTAPIVAEFSPATGEGSRVGIGPDIGPEIIKLVRRSSGVLLRPKKSLNLSENLPSLESALDMETATDSVGEVTVGEGVISNDDATE